MHVRSFFGIESTAEKTAVKHHSANMVGSEITQELHSADVAVEVTERKCQLSNDATYLAKKVAGIDYAYFSQKTSLDRRKQTLLIEAANIFFSSRSAAKENTYYYAHPENAEWTFFEQTASMHVGSFFRFESTTEKTAVKHYSAKMAKSSTAYIPPFQEPTEAPSASDSAIDVSENDNEDDASTTSEAAALANVDVENDRKTSSSQAPTADAGVETSRRGPEQLHVGGLRTGTARIGRASSSSI
ncbi:CRAL-TRIO domain-containing protein [Aphelenchoides avenae]|nr:CRAL-TRIO domain-containing protein [Aphelenchus avenae]